jgi:tRNA-specific 2-thiouridylase
VPNPKTSTNKKVFVGLSGGVDSSVSAALLKRAGYDVTGVFIKVWSPDWLPCSWKEERRDAMRVAACLDIPFLTINLEEEYKKQVVDYFLDEYRKGRTPNPDVMCNKEIKFGSFLKKALDLGADYIATGHYAQVKEIGGSLALLEGADKEKDQSYFLWTLGRKELSRTLFPVGGLKKPEVRKLAAGFGLPTAAKKDSQGICFLGPVDMKEFLTHYIPAKKGPVLDEAGQIIGSHDGALFYTIGERHGFTVDNGKHEPASMPYYVIKKDHDANTLTVSHKYDEGSLKDVTELRLGSVNCIHPLEEKLYSARFRYRQQVQPCRLIQSASGLKVIFEEAQAGVSAGQSLVLYDGETCVGGGIIEDVK